MLTERAVKDLKAKDKPYKVSDGGGLYIYVFTSGSKSWRVKYRFQRKEKTYTIGRYPLISLAEARKAHIELKEQLKQGIDPSEEKKTLTFEQTINRSIDIKKIELDETIIKVENLIQKMQSLVLEIKELSERGNTC